MTSSYDYWQEREEEARRKHIKDEAEYAEEIRRIYKRMYDDASDEIYRFYAKYASDTGITMAEAKKRADTLDMEEYSRKAKEYVKNKDLSKQANDEMKLYNMTMKVNRLEMLKARIGMYLTGGFNDIEHYMRNKLYDRTYAEFKRQAGILGRTVFGDSDKRAQRMAKSIVNASFHNATWADRIWQHQDLLQADLNKILSTALIRGRHPEEFLPEIRQKYGVSSSNASRLLNTEMARVQTQAQMESYKQNGFTEYTFHALGTACPECLALDGKHFKVKDADPGLNCSPMHPNCRCGSSPYEDSEDYEKWLDFLSIGGTTEEYEDWKKRENVINSERERINVKDTKQNVPGHVNSQLVNTKAYHDKFENLSSHKAVNEALYNESLEALNDNNDSEYEDIVAIDSRTGKRLAKNRSARERGVKHACGFSRDETEQLESQGVYYELLHNHPNSSLPSRDDISKLFERGHQSASNISCHDGHFYRLEKLKLTGKHNDDVVDNIIPKIYNSVKIEYQDFPDGKIEDVTSLRIIATLQRIGYLKYIER